jgi:hypothetical protein
MIAAESRDAEKKRILPRRLYGSDWDRVLLPPD